MKGMKEWIMAVEKEEEEAEMAVQQHYGDLTVELMHVGGGKEGGRKGGSVVRWKTSWE